MFASSPRKISYSDVMDCMSVRPVACSVAMGLPSLWTNCMPFSFVPAARMAGSRPAHLMMSTAFDRMSGNGIIRMVALDGKE